MTNAGDNNGWIDTNDRLPAEGQYVLAHVTRDNWGDAASGVYFVVVALERGISREDRERMRRGEIDDPVSIGYVVFPDGGCEHVNSRRSDTTTSADEAGNNRRPYCWRGHGGGKFFGQEVDYWRPIPALDQCQLEPPTYPPHDPNNPAHCMRCGTCGAFRSARCGHVQNDGNGWGFDKNATQYAAGDAFGVYWVADPNAAE